MNSTLLPLVFFQIAVSSCAFAQDANLASRGEILLQLDNDVFVGRDEEYSSGLGIKWISPGYGAVAATYAGDGTRYAVGLSHSILTPRIDHAASVPQRPYAGLLVLDVSRLVHSQDRLSAITVGMGIMGPSARGESLQRHVHKWTGSEPAAGWSGQLRDRAVAQVAFDQVWRSWIGPALAPAQKVIIRAGATAGSLTTGLRSGMEWQFGALEDDFGLAPGQASTGCCRLGGRSGEVRAGGYLAADVQWVGYDATLEAPTFGQRPDVKVVPWRRSLAAGVAISRRTWTLVLSVVDSGRAYRSQDRSAVFLSVQLTRGLQ